MLTVIILLSAPQHEWSSAIVFINSYCFVSLWTDIHVLFPLITHNAVVLNGFNSGDLDVPLYSSALGCHGLPFSLVPKHFTSVNFPMTISALVPICLNAPQHAITTSHFTRICSK